MKLNCIAFTVLLLASLSIKGCKDPYGACEKGALDVGNGIAAGFKTIDDLRVAGKISVQEETNIAGYLEFANKGNGAFGACAQAAHVAGSKPGTYTACANAFSTALNNPTELAMIHVSKPESQAEVQAVVTGILAGITTVITSLGGQ